MVQTSAKEADAVARKKKKSNPDQGFNSYEAMSYRKYEKLTAKIKVRNISPRRGPACGMFLHAMVFS